MVSHHFERKLSWTSAKNVYWVDQQASLSGCTELVAAGVDVCTTNILQYLENKEDRSRLRGLTEHLVPTQPTLSLGRNDTFRNGSDFPVWKDQS